MSAHILDHNFDIKIASSLNHTIQTHPLFLWRKFLRGRVEDMYCRAEKSVCCAGNILFNRVIKTLKRKAMWCRRRPPLASSSVCASCICACVRHASLSVSQRCPTPVALYIYVYVYMYRFIYMRACLSIFIYGETSKQFRAYGNICILWDRQNQPNCFVSVPKTSKL